MYAKPNSCAMEAPPVRVITGAIVSETVTVLVTDAELPPASVAT